MKKLCLLTLGVICCALFSFAQKKFTAEKLENRSQVSLESRFTEYSVYQIASNDIRDYTVASRGGQNNFSLELPGIGEWKLQLTEHDILSPDYTLTVNSGAQRQVLGKPECMTYWGTIEGDNASKVALTIDNNVIYGIIRTGGREYFIEPMNYLVPGTTQNTFVVYETRNARSDGHSKCGVTEMTERAELTLGRVEAGTTCQRVQISIASDESMFIRYGSAAAVQTHNIGVMNNVMWDYVNAQFNFNFEFQILTQNVSTTAANDQLSPAYTGTNSGVILPNFRTWANAGGFGSTTHDLGQFWSTRDFDDNGAGNNNGIIGLAYVGGVCGVSRYQILEDFAGSVPDGSGFLLRVLTSHETGHNFGLSHDGTGTPYIMAPSVQNTSTWSPTSVSVVDGASPYACFSTCATAVPASNFISTPEGVCTGGSITFIDRTLNGPTSWNWTTTGGSPTSSTSRNPVISYATPGIKTISLVATNGVGAGNTVTKKILVSGAPTTATCNPSGTSTTNAGLHAFSLNNITSVSSSASADGSIYVDRTCTQATSLMPSTNYTASVTIGTTNPTNTFNHIRFYIDYNNDGDFTDLSPNELVYTSGGSAYIGTVTFSFTTPVSAIVTDQFLRARVIAADFGSGANPCHVPAAGQVEDFSVFFASASLLGASNIELTGSHTDGKNYLKWMMSGERNNNYFDIERSIDGVNFTAIGRTNSNGNGNNTYLFTDPLANGFNVYQKLYYRVKVTELAGGVQYSRIVPITLKGQKNSFVLTIYPNPVVDNLNATIQLNAPGIVHSQLFDVAGRLVYQDRKSLNAGINTVSFPGIERLSRGSYLLKIQAEGNTITELIQKQ